MNNPCLKPRESAKPWEKPTGSLTLIVIISSHLFILQETDIKALGGTFIREALLAYMFNFFLHPGSNRWIKRWDSKRVWIINTITDQPGDVTTEPAKTSPWDSSHLWGLFLKTHWRFGIKSRRPTNTSTFNPICCCYAFPPYYQWPVH